MWGIIETLGMIHVIPINDTKEHGLSISCECGVYLSEDGVFTHNSFDERELIEELPRC